MAAVFIIIVGWIVTAICCAIVAEDKKHSGAAWGFAGLLFGPIALIAAVGLADRRQHQLLRRIADTLSGDTSNDAISNPELTQDDTQEEGPIEGADDYNTCLEIYRERMGPTSSTAKRPVYSKSTMKGEFIWICDKDGVNLAQFTKGRDGQWTMPFWLN